MYVQNVGRKIATKGNSNEVSGRNEDHVIRQWREGDPFYEVVNNLAELCLCSSVLWK